MLAWLRLDAIVIFLISIYEQNNLASYI